MPTRSRCRLALAATLVVGFVSCNKSPTSPSPGAIVSLKLVAPQEIAPGESVQLTANAVKSSGSIEDVTYQAEWTVQSVPASSVILAGWEAGLAIGRDRGRGVVTVSFGGLTADATIFVLPKGTFRLAGNITDGTVGLENVTVTVISGIGEGLTVQTDFNGDYELYGVAGLVRIRASKNGYLDRAKNVDVAEHGTLWFELTPNRPVDYPVDNYAGIYTLIVTGARCTSGFPEAAKRRVYTARVDQTGPDLWVTLTGADFLDGSGAFAGAVASTGEIRFSIGPSSVWDYLGGGLEERLSDGTVLVTFGTITATSTPAGISGKAIGQESGAGGIFHLPPRGSSWSLGDATGSCYIDRFEMVPQS